MALYKTACTQSTLAIRCWLAGQTPQVNIKMNQCTQNTSFNVATEGVFNGKILHTPNMTSANGKREERRGERLRQPLSLPLIVTSRIFIHASVPSKKTLEVIVSPSLFPHSFALSLVCAGLRASYVNK